VDDDRNINGTVEQDDSYVNAIDVAPLQPPRSLASTPATTVMTQALAIHTDPKLSMSPIMTTTSKTPLATSQRYGLTFAEAKTVIYVCMVLAPACLAFFGLGEVIAAIDLVLVLYRPSSLMSPFAWFYSGYRASDTPPSSKASVTAITGNDKLTSEASSYQQQRRLKLCPCLGLGKAQGFDLGLVLI
jgi:hypothetical protein